MPIDGSSSIEGFVASVERLSHRRMAILLLLFFASGVAALIYEVLWLKELGRLFGVTVYAAAATLAVFFLGLAAGAWAWGARASRSANPLRIYAFLEVGIAATALAYFLILDVYRSIYGPLFAVFVDHPAAFLLVKLLLAIGVLFPPAFFMGGTLPVMAQFIVRRAAELGEKATLLYAVNTAGAATGAFLAGFYLPMTFGFRVSYLLAIALNLLIAGVAFWWSRGAGAAAAIPEPPPRSRPAAGVTTADAEQLRPALFWAIAFGSGFLTLGLEVLWTRMYAQVLQNSVYTFAAVLTTLLIALGLGSGLAHLLVRLAWHPPMVLYSLLTLSGLAVGLTPLIFYRQSSGLEYLSGDVGFGSYIASIFTSLAQVLLLPGILIGSVFPFLIQLAEGRASSAGKTLGRLASVNTTAAILGSLTAGFVLLDAIGLWASIRCLAAAYLVLAICVPAVRAPVARRGTRALAAAGPAAGLAVLAFVLTYADFATVHLDAATGEKPVEVRQGSHGTVVVVDRGGDLRIKVDNSYLVGTSASAPNLRLQSWIPLSLHPHPRSVFYLGMGTGITAGGGLDFAVERVVVSELNPDIVGAARRHFQPYLNHLFDDPRTRVVTANGRTYLYGTDERFDVVIADIFLTYKAGTGSLYTREHYETVRARLAPGGLFAQWLPLFELSRREFGIIARTMLEVFPQVTVWRRGFSPKFPLLALIGQGEATPLDAAAFERNLERLRRHAEMPEKLWFPSIPYAAYAGNLSAARSRFEAYPVATDDRPLVEYLSPITNRDHWGAHSAQVLAFSDLANFLETLFAALAPRDDPYLTNVGDEKIYQVRAGLAFYQSAAYRREGRAQEAAVALREYERMILLAGVAK